MPILTDIKINLNTKQLINSYNKSKMLPVLLEKADEAIKISKALISPTAAYEWFKVEATKNNSSLYVKSDSKQIIRLDIGSNINLISKAEFILASVATIGSKLDDKVRALNRDGESLMAYLVDLVGLMALRQISREIHGLAEKEARKRQWGVSPCLSPGSIDGWDLRDQKNICDMIPMAHKVIRMNKASVLIPFKSVSGIIGIGPEYRSLKVGSVCQVCKQKQFCQSSEEKCAY